MLDDDPLLRPRYRMPRVFGALPGPRNVPLDRGHLPNLQTSIVLSVKLRTDPVLLARLLPPECELDGEPLFHVAVHEMAQIRWLAGRGYSMLVVSLAIKHRHAEHGWLRGDFIPVVWENMADPIITGREELGWPKLYADIPPLRCEGTACHASASWQGFEFFRVKCFDLQDASILPTEPRGMFHYKYIPKTGSLSEAEVVKLGYDSSTLNAAGYEQPVPVARKNGRGSMSFISARWEDLPLMYPVVNALAALPVEVEAATLTKHEVPKS